MPEKKQANAPAHVTQFTQLLDAALRRAGIKTTGSLGNGAAAPSGAGLVRLVDEGSAIAIEVVLPRFTRRTETAEMAVLQPCLAEAYKLLRLVVNPDRAKGMVLIRNPHSNTLPWAVVVTVPSPVLVNRLHKAFTGTLNVELGNEKK